jgi:ATP synthase protein I
MVPIKNENKKSAPVRLRVGRDIVARAARKLRARRKWAVGIWFYIGFFGLIGWAVVGPALIGAALGIWADNRHSGAGHLWTLVLMLVGLFLGCANAVYWVNKEEEEMINEPDDE